LHSMVPASRAARQVYLRPQRVDLFSDRGTCCDEICDDTFVDVEIPLVLAQVADLVALGEHTPDLRSQSQRVRQHLENNVTVRRPEAAIAKGRKTQRVCSV